MIDEGVSLELAKSRKQQIQNIIYKLDLTIPSGRKTPITGIMKIRFDYSGKGVLVLDFKADAENIKKVEINSPVSWSAEKGHIIIPTSELVEGENEITIDFIAGDMSLNRNSDFLYTLFVPDRASTAFPLFDQPDLKAIFNLTLTIPNDWVALANGELLAVDSTAENSTWYFGETTPLSTYLFSFGAGKFTALTHERNGREMTMLHRETDTAKVNRNLKEIFNLHFQALEWLEDYTGIEYPFQKFGFALIPSFQYGGMEHPGGILYNASGLFLDESYTQNQLLGRASVIAHETAHMWFGDLVTMEWFNDVWMKEVFANFMAAKIINPAFPDIDHNLRFLMAHYPSAYSVDRTPGANAIQQDLDNLRNAGQMYGAIIYQKAPIVMRHLESFVGKEIFRASLQEYLKAYSYDNANWDDLVNIIDNNSDQDVKVWSKAWVKEPGMPTLETIYSPENRSLTIVQNDDLTLRPQPVSYRLLYTGDEVIQRLFLSGRQAELILENSAEPIVIIPNPDGFSYGYFKLDAQAISYLLIHAAEISDPVLRGSIYIMMNEAMMNFEIQPESLLNAITKFLPVENELQNAQYILGVLGNIFWRYLPLNTRENVCNSIEELLLDELEKRGSSREKAMIYNAFVNVATSSQSIGLMKSWWNDSKKIPGLTLSENDYTQLAYELAVRGADDSEIILKTQSGNIKNPDRKQRMEFVIPALSSNKEVRDQFFESLKMEINREHEPWVLEALGYLHHPVRSAHAVEYIQGSLELLEEIQKTGDIFFPTRWLGATFSGHNTKAAAEIVRRFLDSHSDYPNKLREKILQTSDPLFRASEWNKESIE